jgi:class 3 adenylate cyclase
MTALLAALLLLAVVTAALAVVLRTQRQEAAQLRTALERKSFDLERLQTSFARFAPEEVIEHVIASGVSTHGDRKEVTALFADLVGFTALSERLEPDVLVSILNGYFERMSRAVTDNRGHVSTFIGDGMLALFGALQPNPWQANDALHAALAMREALEAYNVELERDGLPTLAFGVGLHRGLGVAGLVGSRELMQFTFMGRTVNLAARVQTLTRQYDVDILITDALAENLDPKFLLRQLPATQVRGIEEPVAIYAALGFED